MPDTLKVWFEIAPPASLVDLVGDRWKLVCAAITAATRPGDKCHVEIEIPGVGFYSAHIVDNVRLTDKLEGLNDPAVWKCYDTPYVVTDEFVAEMRSTLGWLYGKEMAFLSAIGRARRQFGVGMCSERGSWACERCGMSALGVVPAPNPFEHLLCAALHHPMPPAAGLIPAGALGDLYDALGLDKPKVGGVFSNISDIETRTVAILDRTEATLAGTDAAIVLLKDFAKRLAGGGQ